MWKGKYCLLPSGFYPAFFMPCLFCAVSWFWSGVSLTFSSPWVRGILHSVSPYPQPPAVSLNQKQSQWRIGKSGRKEREKVETKLGRRSTERERQKQRVGNRGCGEKKKIIKLHPTSVSQKLRNKRPKSVQTQRLKVWGSAKWGITHFEVNFLDCSSLSYWIRDDLWW